MRREAAIEGKNMVTWSAKTMTGCVAERPKGKKNEGKFSLQIGAPLGFSEGAAARVGALGFA